MCLQISSKSRKYTEVAGTRRADAKHCYQIDHALRRIVGSCGPSSRIRAVPPRYHVSWNVEWDSTFVASCLLVGNAVRAVFMPYEQFGIATGIAHPMLRQEARLSPLTPPGTRPSHIGGSKPLAQFPCTHGTADIIDEAPSR